MSKNNGNSGYEKVLCEHLKALFAKIYRDVEAKQLLGKVNPPPKPTEYDDFLDQALSAPKFPLRLYCPQCDKFFEIRKDGE